MARTHRLDAVRAHLLELAGDLVGARAAHVRAARMTASNPERHYLSLRGARLAAESSAVDQIENHPIRIDKTT